MRVLLVEDDRALCLGIQQALEHEGWRVDVLADGEQAAQISLQGEHSLAILDLGLPRKAAWRCCATGGLTCAMTWSGAGLGGRPRDCRKTGGTLTAATRLEVDGTRFTIPLAA